MADKNRPVSFTPRDGGQLISRASAELPGFANYTIKQDFRRELDQELRREGHDWFHPDLTIPIGSQPYPQDQSFVLSSFANGGFETDADMDGIPDGWTVSVGAGIVFSRDSSAAEGVYAAKFVSSTSGATGYIESANYLAVTSGRYWRLGWKHKVSLATFKVLVEVRWFDASLVFLSASTVLTSAAGNPTDYLSFIYNVTPPAGAVYGKVRFYGKDSASSVTGSIWFDNVTLLDKETLTLPITLLGQANRPNGEMAVIAGTPRNLYRYHASGTDDYYAAGSMDGYYTPADYYVPDYFLATDDPFYIAAGYYTAQNGLWSVIGSGFDENGARWEHVNINGWAIFNNGSDLPTTYRVEDDVVIPNYEMREAGVALVGNITEYNGILMCGDIAVLKPDRMLPNFAHIDSGTGELRQHGAAFSMPFTARKLLGYGLDFDGVNDYVTVPASATTNFTGAAITFEMLVKFDVLAGNVVIVSKNKPVGTPWDWYIFTGVTSGLIYLTVNAGASGAVVTPAMFAAGIWYQIGFTWNGTTLRFFVNGQEVASNAFAGPSVNTGGPLTFGSGLLTGVVNGPANVKISEARLWNIARTPQQLLDNLYSDVTGQSGLQAYWKFDEGTGLTTADSTGNGNTGTLTNGPVWFASDAPGDAYIEITSVAAIFNGLTRSGGTATFVGVSQHHLTTGDLVKISGANDANYNGLFTVTVTDPVTFTYAVGGAPPSPDPGAPVERRAWFGTATFNYTGMVGKIIAMLNGVRAVITGVVDPTKVKVSADINATIGDAMFHVINVTTADLTGTVSKNGTTTVTGAGTAFKSQLWPGATILIPGGTPGVEARVVDAIVSDTSLTVKTAFTGTAATQMGSRLSDYALISDVDYFTVAMVGRFIFFDDLAFRKIVTYVTARIVLTDYHTAVMHQQFALENNTAYGRITNASYYGRVQYRELWSDISRPLRFSASVPASITLGSHWLTLGYQARSFNVGDQILIIGAGINGGNLATAIVYVHPDHVHFFVSIAAQADAPVAIVTRADASGSIAGYEDLQDDGSAIINQADLRGTLVIYKDTSIFLGRYTGNVQNPFEFKRVYQGPKTLYYRNTLANADGKAHVYAGKNSFFAFTLVNQTPEEFQILERCSDLFFSQAKLTDTNLIFAGQNAVTDEIFFCFKSATEFKAICLDTRWNTAATSSAAYTALASIKKPKASPAIGVQQDWCIMGDQVGTVMRYGKSDMPEEAWGGVEAIWHRLGTAYQSRLKSGLYGDRFYETDITEWMAELSTQANPNITGYTFNLYGYSNAAKDALLLCAVLLPMPQTANLVPVFFSAHFFQDEIVVDGSNNPLRLAARTVAFSKIASRGHQKAGLV